MKYRFRIMSAVCLIVILMAASEGRTDHRRPADIVDIESIIPGVVLDIRYYGPHNFVGTPIDGYEAPKCLLTRKAALALAKVQKELQAFSLAVKIYDCYRPQKAVNHFVRWAKDIHDTKTKAEFYPTVDKRHLFRDGYIAERSGHSRGSTIDLTIIPAPAPPQEAYTPGQPLDACFSPITKRFRDTSIDMGTGFDCFHEASHPGNLKMGEQQRINRLLLKTLMDKYGFKHYDQEWWHFTLRNEPYPNTYFDFPVR